jgi:AraC family transcriptional regulator of adaptative response/methylated-DNA-[protein]-cysteine methyltransferase
MRQTNFFSRSTEDQLWQAVARRDPAADGQFVYSVRTTGVYCRPTCPSRLAHRHNVSFHGTCADAQRAGFRPCQRCQPAGERLAGRHAAIVTRACRQIESAVTFPSLSELAQAAGLSVYHFHRIFKAQTGVTPKAYAKGQQTQRVRQELATSRNVTSAIYGASYQSSSRFYENTRSVLGMAPQTFQAGGQGMRIRFAIGECWLGAILVAASDQGVCAILLGDDPDELAHDLERRFPRAELVGGNARFERLVAQVVGFVAEPSQGLDLPLDIRGTAFQQRVWQVLRDIPAGSTVSYAEIARRVGRPTAFRAVGQAIGANPVAVAIPCHRVVRTDGSLSGYRWGVARKHKLLSRERDAATLRKPAVSRRVSQSQ